MSRTNWIDPEELPFTQAELFQAAKTFLPELNARILADSLAEIGPMMIATRAERRVSWRAGGLPNAESQLLHGWEYPAELLPALESLSEDLANRVQDLRKRLRNQ